MVTACGFESLLGKKKKKTCLVRPNVSLKTLASVNSIIFLLFGMKVLVRGGFFGAGLEPETS